ncbi:MAG: phosphate signaling complex protein PhoU [Verrucomicrobiia bacterium]
MSQEDSDKNMKQRCDREINDLVQRLLYMGMYTERLLKYATEALFDKNIELARKIKENTFMLGKMAIEIEDFIITLLARAPLASDLRLIVMSTKISQNLERIGEESSKIATRAIEIADRQIPADLDKFKQLSNKVTNMLHLSLEAFEHRNTELAKSIVQKDDEVDSLYKELRNDLEHNMLNNPQDIYVNLNLITIAKRLERIADHTANIAEEVIYISEAHHFQDKTENQENDEQQ